MQEEQSTLPFSTHQDLLKGKKDNSCICRNSHLLCKEINEQQFVSHFFLSFCFFSGLRLCSGFVTPRGMISTLPSLPYWSEYSLGE